MRLKYIIQCMDCNMSMAAQVTLAKETIIGHLQEEPGHQLVVSAVVVG